VKKAFKVEGAMFGLGLGLTKAFGGAFWKE
jgi:hypothetical protein